jgi:hypothetical protein
MRKLLTAILIICLLIGIPLMIIDRIDTGNGTFKIPSGYKKIKIDLQEKVRKNELIYEKELKVPTRVNIMVQCDSDSKSFLHVSSEKKILGNSKKEEDYQINKLTGNSSMSMTYILQPGKYSITITNPKVEGTVMLGYNEKAVETSEYERLSKIDSGDLNNPPEGYEKVYSADLSGLNCKQEGVYTLTLDRTQKIGISVYTNTTKGNVSVDFIGDSSNFTGLVYPGISNICDQLITTQTKGTYVFKLNCEDADGQVVIYMKK